MNEKAKNTIRQKRFEKDAKEGFDLVHGADAYFNQIKSPFEAAVVPKVNPFFKPGMLLLEAVFIAGVIVGAQFLNFDKTAAVQPQPKPQPEVPKTVVVSGQKIADIPESMAPVMPQKMVRATTSQQVLYKLNERNTPVAEKEKESEKEFFPSALTPQKPDSMVVADLPLTIYYPNYKSHYRLVQVEDLLVINYSDTARKPTIKGEMLNHVEAKYENEKNMYKKEDAPVSFNMVENNDYLVKITKPLKAIREKRYKDALLSFKYMLKDNTVDQNALFYSALCCIEMKNPGKALIFLDKLKKVEKPFFDEDADWLLVSAYRGLDRHEDAKALLKKIANSNSYYREQAVKELRK